MVTIVDNLHKGTKSFLKKLETTLQQLGLAYEVASNYPPTPAERRNINQADLLFILGGDGTVLNALSAIDNSHQKFILAVNFGTLGYISDVGQETSLELLKRFSQLEITPQLLNTPQKLHALGNEAGIIFDPRAMLHSVSHPRFTVDNGTHTALETTTSLALNEIVIKPAQSGRPIALEVNIGAQKLCSFLADGALVATPTGSTAYNLSANGPIVSADVDALVFNAICPHSISMKPLVVGAREKLTIVSRSKALAYSDGQKKHILAPEQPLCIEQAKQKPIFIHNRNYNRYDLLKKKLNWGQSFSKYSS